jgi:DNA-binding transcriptional MerR regulator
MAQELVSISEASIKTGLSPKDVEYAEQMGLLSTGREVEGYYAPPQLRVLEGIARLRQLGLSIDEIIDLNLSEDLLAEIQEYLGMPRGSRPLLDLSAARHPFAQAYTCS